MATQNPELVNGLVVTDKRTRVKNFHDQTLNGVAEIFGAMGIKDHKTLSPHFFKRRVSQFDVKSLAEIVPWVNEGSYLQGDIPERVI